MIRKYSVGQPPSSHRLLDCRTQTSRPVKSLHLPAPRSNCVYVPHPYAKVSTTNKYLTRLPPTVFVVDTTSVSACITGNSHRHKFRRYVPPLTSPRHYTNCNCSNPASVYPHFPCKLPVARCRPNVSS